jgi:hypothetical protein
MCNGQQLKHDARGIGMTIETIGLGVCLFAIIIVLLAGMERPADDFDIDA